MKTPKKLIDRPIEFRFWCPAALSFIRDYDYSGSVNELFAPKDFDVLVPSQFTGMVDWNQTKIFEGDIIRIIDTYDEEPDIAIHPVTWKHGGWQYDGDFLCEYMLLGGVVDGEVIGNIFENPDICEPMEKVEPGLSESYDRLCIPRDFKFPEGVILYESHYRYLCDYIFENLPQGGTVIIPRPRTMGEKSFQSYIEQSMYFMRAHPDTFDKNIIGTIEKNGFVVTVFLETKL